MRSVLQTSSNDDNRNDHAIGWIILTLILCAVVIIMCIIAIILYCKNQRRIQSKINNKIKKVNKNNINKKTINTNGIKLNDSVTEPITRPAIIVNTPLVGNGYNSMATHICKEGINEDSIDTSLENNDNSSTFSGKYLSDDECNMNEIHNNNDIKYRIIINDKICPSKPLPILPIKKSNKNKNYLFPNPIPCIT
eukprot:465543_1